MAKAKMRLTAEELQGLEEVAASHRPTISAEVIARLFLLGLITIAEGKLVLTSSGKNNLLKEDTLKKLKTDPAAISVALT